MEDAQVQGQNGQGPADGGARQKEAPPDGTIRMRIEGTYVELNLLKLDGLEMRTVERMTNLPYAEAADWAERGSGTSLLAFIYVALVRAGSTVGTPDEFLSSWSLERLQRVERLPDPTPAAEAESAATEIELDSLDSGSRDSVDSGVRGGLVSTASDPGNPIG